MPCESEPVDGGKDMGRGTGQWLALGIGGVALAVSACFGGATVPSAPTPAPTVVQLPTVPRPALDTAVPSGTGTASAQVVHVVQDGDTLGRIALRYYGDANRWQRIYDANRAAIPNPNALTVGTRLNIPPP